VPWKKPRKSPDNLQANYAAFLGILRTSPCLLDGFRCRRRERQRRAFLLTKMVDGSMWFRVTDPAGNPVWLQADQCSRVRPPVAQEKHAKALIDGSFGSQAVTESMEVVMKVLRKNE
jgi:hypothetical protein